MTTKRKAPTPKNFKGFFTGEELIAKLDAADFGDDGLRIFPKLKALPKEEYDFLTVIEDLKAMPFPSAMMWIRHEYGRELKWIYTSLNANYRAWWGFPPWNQRNGYNHETTMQIDSVFGKDLPMSLTAIKRKKGYLEAEEPQPIFSNFLDSIEGLTKRSQGDIFIKLATDPNWIKDSEPVRYYGIRIDWSQKKSDLMKELGRWVDQNTQPKKGRSEGKTIEDRFNQLAAWRAHRSGLDWNGYTKLDWKNFRKLNPGKNYPYNDPASFRNGWERALERLEGYIQESQKITVT